MRVYTGHSLYPVLVCMFSQKARLCPSLPAVNYLLHTACFWLHGYSFRFGVTPSNAQCLLLTLLRDTSSGNQRSFFGARDLAICRPCAGQAPDLLCLMSLALNCASMEVGIISGIEGSLCLGDIHSAVEYPSRNTTCSKPVFKGLSFALTSSPTAADLCPCSVLRSILRSSQLYPECWQLCPLGNLAISDTWSALPDTPLPPLPCPPPGTLFPSTLWTDSSLTFSQNLFPASSGKLVTFPESFMHLLSPFLHLEPNAQPYSCQAAHSFSCLCIFPVSSFITRTPTSIITELIKTAGLGALSKEKLSLFV